MSWPNVLTLVRAHLTSTLGVPVSTRLPGELEQSMPRVRIAVAGGSDDGLNDFPSVDVECFTADEGAMWDLAERARDAMLDLRNKAVGGKLVDTVTTTLRPMDVDYENPAVHRSVSTFSLTLRQQ